ncbi:MAG: CBS domain-containing protein [Kofleriaceae bacterium]
MTSSDRPDREAIDRLIEALVVVDPDGAARALERLQPAEVAAWFHELQQRHRDDDGAGLDRERCATLFARMDSGFAASTIEAVEALHAGDAAAILDCLPATVVAKVLRAASTPTIQAVLAACSHELAATVRTLLAHPARSAGTLMDPQVPSVMRDATAAAALELIRSRPARFKHYVYVVERGGRLVGVTRVIDLLAAAPDAIVEHMMHMPVVRISVAEPEVAVLAHPGWLRFRCLPVVDRDERLLGVIRDDDMRGMQQRLTSAHAAAPIALTLSFAELCWVGLAGVTEGVASAVLNKATAPPRDRAKDPIP